MGVESARGRESRETDLRHEPREGSPRRVSSPPPRRLPLHLSVPTRAKAFPVTVSGPAPHPGDNFGEENPYPPLVR